MGAWASMYSPSTWRHTDAEERAEMGGAGAVEVEEAAPLLATIVKAACLTGLVPTPAMCRVALRLDHGARTVAWSNAPLGRRAPQQTAVPVQGAPSTALGSFALSGGEAFWSSVQAPSAYGT